MKNIINIIMGIGLLILPLVVGLLLIVGSFAFSNDLVNAGEISQEIGIIVVAPFVIGAFALVMKIYQTIGITFK